ncbi:hypothetical protein [Bradyrhizobium diazoefficiens]|uniref:hypothetical protein n=1 Tax=Bradyrhizobium diazoefficiens TaxID=1355477 RepID=UPI0027297A3E|nr:hypothetical protein [Bradyrhizobium diazoefficiens]WLA65487.1 hypothetical protein QNN01_00885 [Bradyrhizobium diazoefficiens]
MTDTTVTNEAQQTPPPQQQAQPERVTRRDLAEGNAEKVVSERTEAVTLFKGGGVDYANLRDMVDAAKLLSAAGPMIPPWLQGNVGGMFGICMKAQELDISPLSLASWTYTVEQYVNGQKVERVAYESQFFHAIIEQRAPITTRLQVDYEGEGDKRRCRVWATFKGEKQPRYFPPLDADPDQFTLGKLHPGHNDKGKVKGSPLWDKKPDLQPSRDWARMYCPDIIAGMYGRDEMEDAGFTVASDAAEDVSPRLAQRLSGNAPAIGQAAIAAIDAHAASHAPKPKPKSEAEAPSTAPATDAAGDRPSSDA